MVTYEVELHAHLLSGEVTACSLCTRQKSRPLKPELCGSGVSSCELSLNISLASSNLICMQVIYTAVLFVTGLLNQYNKPIKRVLDKLKSNAATEKYFFVPIHNQKSPISQQAFEYLFVLYRPLKTFKVTESIKECQIKINPALCAPL